MNVVILLNYFFQKMHTFCGIQKKKKLLVPLSEKGGSLHWNRSSDRADSAPCATCSSQPDDASGKESNAGT